MILGNHPSGIWMLNVNLLLSPIKNDLLRLASFNRRAVIVALNDNCCRNLVATDHVEVLDITAFVNFRVLDRGYFDFVGHRG